MRNAILADSGEAVCLPNDPFARHAATLGRVYLWYGHESEDLEALLERDLSHSAYRETLNIVVSELRTAGVEIPERLRRWEKERGNVTGRKRPEATRDYRIGLVIESMATGLGVSSRDGEFYVFFRRPGTDSAQLELDLAQIFGNTGNRPDRLP